MSAQPKASLKIDPKAMNKIWDLSNDAYSRIILDARKEIEQEDKKRQIEKASRGILRRILGVPGMK
jgi:hypothetical protein